MMSEILDYKGVRRGKEYILKGLYLLWRVYVIVTNWVFKYL